MKLYASDPVRSVYIHWPFCPYKCHFCPFVAIASHDQFMTQYHYALLAEIEVYKDTYIHEFPLETVYFGGGTPSTYPNDLLLDMLVTLKTIFGIQKNAEITVEVNPGTVRPGQLEFWKSIGITRLSIGVQSLKDSVLKDLNRHQLASDVFVLLEQASLLFDSLSIDLIVGLPGVSPDEWKSMVEQIVTWPIQHISVYFLTVHEDTILYYKVKKKEVVLHTDDMLVDLYSWTRELLFMHGFEQYEISNFSRPNHHSRHNKVYWARKPYKAFGLGACSFDGTQRMQNEKNLMRYMASAGQKESVQAFCEVLTREQIHLEKVMLGLRQRSGILKIDLFENLTNEEKSDVQNRLKSLLEADFIKYQDGYLKLTSKGIFVENKIAAYLSL